MSYCVVWLSEVKNFNSKVLIFGTLKSKTIP